MLHITKMHLADVPPSVLRDLDWFTELALHAEKHLSLQEKAEIIADIERTVAADPLLQAQEIEIFQTGGFLEMRTSWGSRPVCGTAFEESAVKALITAAAGDPVAVYALAIAAGDHANRRALERFTVHHAQPGARHQFSLGDIEEVLANRESIILDMCLGLFSFASFLNSDGEITR